MPADVLERLWPKVAKSDVGCWEWLAHTNSKGYGTFWASGRHVLAHRFVYEIEGGAVSDDHQMDHLCRNPSCVRPDHLEPVSPRENSLRGETVAARHLAQTHCVNGHPFDGENTYIHPRGGRRCRTCANESARRYKARVKA